MNELKMVHMKTDDDNYDSQTLNTYSVQGSSLDRFWCIQTIPTLKGLK